MESDKNNPSPNSTRINVCGALKEAARSPCLANDLHLRSTLNDHNAKFLANMGKLEEEVKRKLERHDIKNNSLQWQSNLKNIEFPDILRPSQNIETDRKNLSFLLPKPIETNETKSTEIKFSMKRLIPVVNEDKPKTRNPFKSAMEILEQDENVKLGMTNRNNPQSNKIKRHKSKKFISPLLSNINSQQQEVTITSIEEEETEKLKNLDPNLVKLIKSEIMDVSCNIEWDDIAGLKFAKAAIQEAVVWPMLRPDLFTGLRRPPKGILLFGPPGTGKTLIGKCVASQSKSTFFSISASSLTSKYVGEGEKLVRTLFAVARCHQPAVIFMDELDSLLSQRSDSEHECSRRIKTEFLVQLDGAKTDSEERLLIIGATNRPQELDEAARRRFVKRLYIPLPAYDGRYQLVKKLMEKEKNSLTEEQFGEISTLTDGYSGADIKTLCSDACLGPIRSLDFSLIGTIKPCDVRPVSFEDFRNSLVTVRSSVSANDLEQYVIWDRTYGSGS